MKNKSFILLIFTVFSLLSCSSEKEKPPIAIKGEIDLTNWDFNNKEIIKLEGEWEFYWNQFLHADDFLIKNTTNTPYYGKVPGTWNDYVIDGKTLDGHGFATYRLTLLINESREPLVFKFLPIQSACRIYLNGKLVGSGGIPGKSIEESEPDYTSQSISFTPDSNSIELIIQVSNFDHRKGGLWGVVTFGSQSAMSKEDNFSRDTTFFIIGAILVIGIYYLGLFFIRKQEKEAIYFTLYCFALALRILVTGEIFLLKYIPETPWKMLISIEYITFFAAIPLFMLFIYSLFQSSLLKKGTKVVMGISTIFSLLTITTPVSFCSYLIPVYQYITLIVGVYIIVILVKHSLQKNTLARVILTGFVLMFATVINDILYSADIINTFYALSYGILLFIIFQSMAMTTRYAKSFGEVERQQRQLQKTNMEYRSEIDERIRLEEELHLSYQKNAKSRLAIIMGLAKLAEYRDSDTGTHIERIQEFNTILATQLQKNAKYKDYISDEYIEDLHISSILHDIGKVGIPDSILQKPGKLTSMEFEIMKSHSVIGGDSISTVEQKTGERSFLTLGRDIAYMHHEKWDGTGYPGGLKGEEIPLSARLTALADVYDALTSKRCYKEAFSHEKAMNIITDSKGTHFDPDIVDAFIEVEGDFNRIRNSLEDEIDYVQE